MESVLPQMSSAIPKAYQLNEDYNMLASSLAFIIQVSLFYIFCVMS
jgi:hypothetical protein